MIKYALKCENDHSFESWFASADAYETLCTAGHVTCVVCGSTSVQKAMMAPRVSQARGAEPANTADDATAETPLERLRKDVEDNATYVGGSFAREARAQYLGDMPDRPIWGEANADEAKSLIEDGVPVAPLPFMPTRKTN